MGRCITASEQHSHTTRRLLDEDRQEDKRVFTGMYEILKTKIGKLEDTIDKALEGRIAAIEGDMKEMKGDMKEMKNLLLQLVGSNNVETKTRE